MTERHGVLRWLLLVFLVAPLGAQDVIKLKTGGTFEGVITGETEATMTIQFPGGTLEIRKTQIDSVTRAAPTESRDAVEVLGTLSRLGDLEAYHFLYRDGHRVGYRTLTLRREIRSGIAGYSLVDRMIFVPRPGAQPELDTQITEFVDAGLAPREFAVQLASGLSSRASEGFRNGEALRIVEHGGGKSVERTALFRDGTAFPNLLLTRLATEAVPEGGYSPFRTFSPRELEFGVATFTRETARVTLRGKLMDVIVFRDRAREVPVETWVDVAGRIVRQEIGSPRLFSQLAPREDVLAYASGEDVPDQQELALEFVSEETGLRLLRPDNSWEETPGTPSRNTLVTFLHPGHRASVDVIHLGGLDGKQTEDGVADKVLSRMQGASREWKITGPEAAEVGEKRGLRFTATCRKHDTDITTLGAVFVHEQQAYVILGAAPAGSYERALPGFLEVLDSVRILTPEGTKKPADPFDAAESSVRH